MEGSVRRARQPQSHHARGTYALRKRPLITILGRKRARTLRPRPRVA